jgi:hypothetical protein
MKEISINELIKILEKEKQKGAETVFYKGTLVSENGNSIIITTERQYLMKYFTNLREMNCSSEYNDFLESKLGNDLFISEPDRASRIADGEGSTHNEIIEDFREYLNSLKVKSEDDDENFDITQEVYDTIESDINSCEEWHINNGSINDIAGV